MARYRQALLQDQSDETREFAEFLIAHKETAAYQYGRPALADLALWGIDADEWELVGRALHIETISKRLSHRTPAIILVQESASEDVSHRIAIMARQEIRHQAIEDWLGREMDTNDMALLQEFANALPMGWMIVLEGRSQHQPDNDSCGTTE